MICGFSDMMLNRINHFCIFDCCWVKKEKLRTQQIHLFAHFPSCSSHSFFFCSGGCFSRPYPPVHSSSFLPSFLSLPCPPHLLHSSSLLVLWKFRVQTSLFTHSHSACLKPTEHEQQYERFHLKWLQHWIYGKLKGNFLIKISLFTFLQWVFWFILLNWKISK